MDTPPRPAPESTRFGRSVPLALGVVFLVFACFLFPKIAPYAGGADSSGYLNSARLLASGDFVTPIRTLPGKSPAEFGPGTHLPLGFLPLGDGTTMAPTYPLGLPLHLLAASPLGWDAAPRVVNLFALLLAGGATFALARRLGLRAGFAGGLVVVFWACPLTIFAAVQPMSDLLATAWATTALYCALRSRDNWRWGLATGLSVGIAVLVRPTNVLIALPLVVAFGFDWRSYFATALGGLPAAILLLCYNNALYGSPLLTGYGNPQGMFSAAYVSESLAHYARFLPQLLGPFVVLALAVPFFTAGRTRNLLVLAAWTAALMALYASYYHTRETWWYLRFVLPAFPALLLMAGVALQGILPPADNLARHRTRLGVACIALLATLGLQFSATRSFDVFGIAAGEKHYFDAANWARSNLPPDAVVLTMQLSGAFFCYTDLVLVRWEQISAAHIAAFKSHLAERRTPLYAALYDFETTDAQARIGGSWRKVAVVGNTTFWQVTPNG